MFLEADAGWNGSLGRSPRGHMSYVSCRDRKRRAKPYPYLFESRLSWRSSLRRSLAIRRPTRRRRQRALRRSIVCGSRRTASPVARSAPTYLKAGETGSPVDTLIQERRQCCCRRWLGHPFPQGLWVAGSRYEARVRAGEQASSHPAPTQSPAEPVGQRRTWGDGDRSPSSGEKKRGRRSSPGSPARPASPESQPPAEQVARGARSRKREGVEPCWGEILLSLVPVPESSSAVCGVSWDTLTMVEMVSVSIYPYLKTP